MIGHLELAIGMLTSHASRAWLIKICLQSQIFLRCVRADLYLIVNAERFTRIDGIFDYERNRSINHFVSSHSSQLSNLYTHSLSLFLERVTRT